MNQPSQLGNLEQNTDYLVKTSQPKVAPTSDPFEEASNPLGTQASQPADNHISGVNDCEIKDDVVFFSNTDVRRAFIRKVFAILSVQIAITLALTCLFVFERNTKQFVQSHIELVIVAFIIKIIVLLALICFGELRRKVPTNYILLFMFTVSMAFLVATIASFYDVLTVVLALGFTTFICVGLCVFAMQTKWVFTTLGSSLFVFFLDVICICFISITLYSRFNEIIIGGIGAWLFSIYLIYDIQLMMGGKHRYQISPEEYIFAALNIFIDVIQIFLYILRIIGAGR